MIFEDSFDLDLALANDRDGAVLRKVKDALHEAGQQVRQSMDAGLPPDEFQKAERLHKAFGDASEVVEKAWNNLRAEA